MCLPRYVLARCVVYRPLALHASGSYMIFCSENRDKIKEEMPELKNTEVMVELGKRWQLLTDEEKVVYATCFVLNLVSLQQFFPITRAGMFFVSAPLSPLNRVYACMHGNTLIRVEAVCLR
jgi:hypothetical protein